MRISRYLNSETKRKLCDAILKPVLVDGSESWTLIKSDVQKLRTFEEMRIIFRANGKKKDGELNEMMSNMTYIIPLK
jgi:hypothetical protein